MDMLRILVVDDEPGMRLGVARALSDFTVHLPDVNGEVGFAVGQAASGEQALESIRRQAPDILLLDHKLPGISGLDVLEAVAGAKPTGAAGPLGDGETRPLAQSPGRPLDGDPGEPLAPDMLTVMITAYATLETAVSATKRGAYDFLAKPFTPDELKSVVRKAAGRLILAKQARKLAQEKRQVRFQFISVLAHELKAPLGAIEGYLHILRDRSAGDEQAVYDRMVQRSLVRARQMGKLIGDLLDMTRIESGQLQRKTGPMDLVETSRTAIETVAPAAAEREIAVRLHADGPAPMVADPSEIEMILNNLLTNAVKYNRPGGQVDLTVRAADGRAVIEVADTGIGMEPAEVERLFSEFFRARNEDTRDILGSGLGLSIVKKLAALYGGDVTVSSRRNVGSTFTVVLQC